jgi:hypothetical protein
LAIVPPPVLEKVNVSRRPRRARLHLLVRASLVAVALLLIGIFAIAIALDPYKDGKLWLSETHRQLGLPPCTFKAVTGYPCPSCGMSSSFALAVRGDLWHSAEANFVGTLLAIAGLIFIPWAVASAIKGRLLGVRNVEKMLVVGVFGFVILMFGRWGIVLALMYFNK